jgi:hypothetical protein
MHTHTIRPHHVHGLQSKRVCILAACRSGESRQERTQLKAEARKRVRAITYVALGPGSGFTA